MSLTWLFADSSAKSKGSKPIALKNLRVASPCRADWTQMSGDDRVRHCAECKLNVYNLSEMTRREAERFIADREGRLCVRFYRRADGTVLTRDCPVGFRQLVRKVSRFAGAALSAVMSVSFCAAQITPSNGTQATASNDQKKSGILVTVTDLQGAVISGAQVGVLMEGTKSRIITTTDRNGVAVLSGLRPGSYKLEVNSQGFKAYRINTSLVQDKIEQIRVKLVERDMANMGIMVGSAPMIDKTESMVTHTFEGDLLKAATAH